MHYANGAEAKVGDKIVGKDCNGKPLAGFVVEIQPGTDTCNLTVIPSTQFAYMATAKECLLLEDVIPEDHENENPSRFGILPK